MIEVCDASFSYGRGDFVLRGVSARLEPGERVVLLGLNGSGKSTLGRLLNGSLRPTEGSVSIDGQREGLARLVGYVRQDPRNQIVSPVVWDEVAFGPRNLALPLAEVEARVDEALVACGISDLAQRMTSELSGGQQQLLAMAGAIAMRPRYLVLDEVGSQLDEASRRRVADLVGRLVDSGVGVLEIAHSPEALFGAHRAIVLSDGKVAWTGSPRDLLADSRALELSGFAEDALAQCLSKAVGAGYQMGNTPDAGEISSYLTEKDLDPAPTGDSSAARELLEARDVSVSYESVEALSHVSLSAGGVSVLLGACPCRRARPRRGSSPGLGARREARRRWALLPEARGPALLRHGGRGHLVRAKGGRARRRRCRRGGASCGENDGRLGRPVREVAL